MKLVGANPNTQIVGLGELPGKSNYFLGNDSKNWHTNIPTYARVQYRNIYPGINLIYYGNQRQLEYDFVVAPGADPKAIRLAFFVPSPLVGEGQDPSRDREGAETRPLADARGSEAGSLPSGEREPVPSFFAPSPLAADKGRYHEPKDGKAELHPLSDSPPSKGERKEVPSPLKGEGEDGGESRLPLRIDDNGDLILHTAGGELRLHKPRIYQEINGIKQPIPGGYVLLKLRTSNLEPQQVSFQVAAYDTSKPLIIDPTLSYSTYLGGSGFDSGDGITVDSAGNIYVAGTTDSTNFPTQSPFQGTYAGGTGDTFVTKLNSSGTALVYSTYLGGQGRDGAIDLAIDAVGSAYVTGLTVSTNFPTQTSFQGTYGGGIYDAFVAKIVEPVLSVTPTSLDFGRVTVGKSKDLSFTVQNTGEGTLAGTATATDPFSVVANSSFDVDAGDLVLVTVRFSPPTKGPFTGTVEFTSNGGDESATVMGRGWQLPFGLSEGEVVPVGVDIQPGGGAVGIDCQGAEVIEVRVFDVGGLSSPIVMEGLTLEGSGPPQSWASADADGDEAEDDLVVHFGVEGVSDEACQEGVTSFFLTGELVDGTPIEGWDEVRIVRGR